MLPAWAPQFGGEWSRSRMVPGQSMENTIDAASSIAAVAGVPPASSASEGSTARIEAVFFGSSEEFVGQIAV